MGDAVAFQSRLEFLVLLQVVAGTNYFVKIKVGPEAFAHVRIFQVSCRRRDGMMAGLFVDQPLPCNGSNPELSSVKWDVGQGDDIAYF